MRIVLLLPILLAILLGCLPSKEEKNPAQEFEQILTPYFSIVEALSKDDFKQAQAGAQKLYSQEATDGVKLALKNLGKLMIESPSLYEQRIVLAQMGVVLPLYIEQLSLHDFTFYRFSCKEKFNGKDNIWFSNLKESRNPYVGNSSSECVELIETIDPVLRK